MVQCSKSFIQPDPYSLRSTTIATSRANKPVRPLLTIITIPMAVPPDRAVNCLRANKMGRRKMNSLAKLMPKDSLVYPKAYKSAIIAACTARKILESISSKKICRISWANAASPPENTERIGLRNIHVSKNPNVPQATSTRNTLLNTFRARSFFPLPIFWRIMEAPPSPMLPAGTVDNALILLDTPKAPTVWVP